MDKKFLQKIQKKLEKEKKDLEKSLKGIATKDKKLKDDYDAKFEDLGSEVFDPTSEAQEVAQYDTRMSLEANLEIRLRDVKKALEQMRKKTYGKCKKCGREIEKKRLEAFSTATTCCHESCGK